MKSTEGYSFDAAFEKAVVTLACSNSRFYSRIGTLLDPELFRLETSKHAMRAAHAIFKDTGKGPDRSVLVIQRLRGWMADGKVTHELIKATAELFDAAMDAPGGIPEIEGVIAELKPIIQQRIRDEAVQVGIEAFGQKRDLSKVVQLEAKAASVGIADNGAGVIIGSGSWEEIEKMRDIPRMPTGISELDHELDGGLERGGLGIWIGGPGDGKSMALSHTAAFNLMKGAFVGYATLELPIAEVMARIKANISNIPINALKAGDTALAKQLVADRCKGDLRVEAFTPLATTFDDIVAWVERCEEAQGRRMDLLVVDYGDKVGVKKAKGAKDDESGYSTGRVVFEGMRIWAVGDSKNSRFCWTASQGTRRKDRKKRLDLDDAADSMHKVRVGDLIITLNVQDGDGEGTSIKPFVAKHRTGKSRFELGPYPTAFDVGQIIPN